MIACGGWPPESQHLTRLRLQRSATLDSARGHVTDRITPSPIPPDAVHATIDAHLIGDGMPLVFDLQNSHGSWVVDSGTGREYLDFYAFFASLPLGFHHPAFQTPENRERLYAAAIHKPANSDVASAELAGFVRAFAREAMPPPFQHLFLIDGGALAVENGLKAAFDWKAQKNRAAGRSAPGSQILHFRQAFHGRSGYTMSLTNTQPVKVAHYPKFDWPRVTNPTLRFPVSPEEVERVAVLEAQALQEIEEAFAANPHEIAAIIIEPIQGEGGDNHFRGEFLARLREVDDRQEALLIFDEVQTGFGGTGRMWAFQHFGVTPDIICFGKKTQVCGIMTGPRLDEVPDNVFTVSSRINSTWGGSLTDMVRCQIILDVMRDENLVQNAATVGAHLQQRLRDLQTEFPAALRNARGRGLMCAFDCPDAASRDAILTRALEHGVLLLRSGDCALRMRPALTLSPAEVDEGYERLRNALRDG